MNQIADYWLTNIFVDHRYACSFVIICVFVSHQMGIYRILHKSHKRDEANFYSIHTKMTQINIHKFTYAHKLSRLTLIRYYIMQQKTEATHTHTQILSMQMLKIDRYNSLCAIELSSVITKTQYIR